MGIIGKLKEILFEDPGEDIPVFKPEDGAKASAKQPEKEEVPQVIEKTEEVPIEPIKTTSETKFRNVKRDIDMTYDDDDVLSEVPGAADIRLKNNSLNDDVAPLEPELKDETSQKKDVFLSFDEDEFERLNARINHNENKVKRETPVKSPMKNTMFNQARRANNNFSPTISPKEVSKRDSERYRNFSSTTTNTTKKPFTPSPVISPVYGILDKNYTKDDIIDKKDGLKRERVNKEVVKNEVVEEEVEENKKEVEKTFDIDTIRKKAYGELTGDLPVVKEEKSKKEEEPEETVETPRTEDVYYDEEEIQPEENDNQYEVDNTPEVSVLETDDEDDAILDEKQKESIKAPRVEAQEKKKILDDLEKTSTLQILDDIEKELSSIKPISKEYKDDEDEEVNTSQAKDDTLEKDLFNLIDSMYEQGEEEEDD